MLDPTAPIEVVPLGATGRSTTNLAAPAGDSPTSVGVREKGYASALPTWSSLSQDQLEEIPELLWPNNLRVYDQMVRSDPQIASVLRAVIFPVIRTGWRVDPNGAEDHVVRHVAADLGLPVLGDSASTNPLRGRGRFSWNKHIRLALQMLKYGHSAFEQVYRIDDGLAHLRKLGHRPARTISRFDVARDGGLNWIQQHAIDGSSPRIPINRLVMYVLDQEGSNWRGQSLLRPAYKSWILKDRLLRVQTMSGERNGMGIPLAKNHEQGTQEDLEKLAQLAADTRAGDNSGLAIPHGAEFGLLGVTGQLPDLDKPIRYHDEQIARSVLAHFLNLGAQAGTGSYALGSTFHDFFTLSLQAVAQEVADTGTEHIVEDLVDANWGPTARAPRIVFDEIGTSDAAIVQAIAFLVQSGVLRADEDLEDFTRTALRLPPYNPAKAIKPQEAQSA